MKLRKIPTYSLLFTLFMAAGLCYAQEPRVIVRSAPERPVAGTIWTLTLLIAHNEPNEVEVLAPNFTGALFLDQLIKGPRFFNPSTGNSYINHPIGGTETETAQAVFERWTAMEYRFLLSAPGTVSFDAFTVITPGGQQETVPFDLIVERPRGTLAIQNYRLVWEGAPALLTTGENVILKLNVHGHNSMYPQDTPLPPEAMFLPPIPPDHILESIPLSLEEKSAGMALKLRFIPLEASPLVLERRQFSHNGALYEIPALRIPVRQGVINTGQINTSPQKIDSSPAFPSLETAARSYPGLYQKRPNECEALYAEAKNLWEGGERAKAMAVLRHNEREHQAGALFAFLRREAEASLGFTGTNDEKKNLLPFFGGNARSAVLRETIVRQIPDAAGDEIARFREGQPVLLDEKINPKANKQHESWLRVITNDDNEISGWVPAENVIFF